MRPAEKCRFEAEESLDELRYWYDKCMPQIGARDAWERVLPATWDAKSIAALIRSAAQA
ncbi:MAG: hypothetical protein WDA16_03715 [Candidatus Thermoplasmatota archaeon]